MIVVESYLRIVARWRWSLLLVFLIITFLAEGVTTTSAFGEILGFALYTMICVGALFLIQPPQWLGRIGISVLAVWMTFNFTNLGLPVAVADWLRISASSILVAGTLALTFHQLFSQDMNNSDRLAGGVFGYFLMAMVWAMLFVQVESNMPGSFDGVGSGKLAAELLYFSMITITSLGYGDILPVSSIARILSGFEAAGGTLYIAIFIGRVVGSFGRSGWMKD